MKNKKLYIVLGVEKEHKVEVMTVPKMVSNIPLKWTDGMVGVCAVFESKRKAEKYADGKFSIQEVRLS